MNTPSLTPWDETQARLRELADLDGILGLAHWDQRVTMPPGGAASRASQLGTLSAIRHERLTHPRLVELSETLDPGDDPVKAAALRSLRRAVRQATRTPARLVSALAEAEALTYNAWTEAKAKDDLAPFAGPLTGLIALVREKIDACRDGEADPYDVLLDAYDPGTTVASLDPMFARLTEGLKTVLDRVKGLPQPPPLTGRWPLEPQRALHKRISAALGYDYDRGRFDETVHPFSVSVGHGDARLCAHLYEDDLLRGLTGTLHEAGHAMYEQGLPQRWRGLGIDAAASYGLHESQSRFWENVIGRSAAFCQLLARETNLTFPDAPARPEQLFGALNRVEPSLIRIFADEVTYNLHIALRYRLERALLSGALPVADLPGAWDDGMEATLGVRPTKLSEGALQDVHWSSGLFGYFPSYTLGNLYAAALRFTMEAQVPTLWDDVARGDLSPALGFLRTHIHDKGHLLDAPALVESVTGPRDLVADLIAHLNQRVSEAYGV
ncbi:MAG: hypothetical protein RIT28_4552 [Pseudomonadota bacterium]